MKLEKIVAGVALVGSLLFPSMNYAKIVHHFMQPIVIQDPNQEALEQGVERKLHPMVRKVVTRYLSDDRSDLRNKLDIQKRLSRTSKYTGFIVNYSERYNVPYELTYSLIARESAGLPRLVSPAGAKGLGQIREESAESVRANSDIKGKDLFDPETNIQYTAFLLSWFKRMWDKKYKEDVSERLKWDLALSSYHRGFGGTNKAINKHGLAKRFFDQKGIRKKGTRQYVADIRGYEYLLRKELVEF